MPIEHEIRDGALVWIKNPITGVISYVVDVRGKSFAFTLGGREELNPDLPPVDPKALRNAMAACPFCPGNEHMAPAELMRVTPADFPNWPGAKSVERAEWIMRVCNNRIIHSAPSADLAPGQLGKSAGVTRINSAGAICSLPGQNGHAAIALRSALGSTGGKSGLSSSRPPRVKAKLLPRTSTTYEMTPVIGFFIQTSAPSRISCSIGMMMYQSLSMAARPFSTTVVKTFQRRSQKLAYLHTGTRGM